MVPPDQASVSIASLTLTCRWGFSPNAQRDVIPTWMKVKSDVFLSTNQQTVLNNSSKFGKNHIHEIPKEILGKRRKMFRSGSTFIVWFQGRILRIQWFSPLILIKQLETDTDLLQPSEQQASKGMNSGPGGCCRLRRGLSYLTRERQGRGVVLIWAHYSTTVASELANIHFTQQQQQVTLPPWQRKQGYHRVKTDPPATNKSRPSPSPQLCSETQSEH